MENFKGSNPEGENIEAERRKKYLDIFRSAHAGDEIPIPLDLITTTVTEEEAFRASHSEGTPTAYGLINKGTGEPTIWLKDGHHRLFAQVREARGTAIKNETYRDEQTFKKGLMITIQRVPSTPNDEDDIRFMWGCGDKFQDMEIPKKEV